MLVSNNYFYPAQATSVKKQGCISRSNKINLKGEAAAVVRAIGVHFTITRLIQN
jgi:hypothetical protein